MKRSAWNATLTTALFMLAIAPQSAFAQQAEQSLNDKQNAWSAT
jgi:hypothetical protein